MNNNAGDIHPIDIKRKDKKGNPVVIGVLPLTASIAARESEFNAYIKQFYDGKIPDHLLPVIRNINSEKAASMQKNMDRSASGRGL